MTGLGASPGGPYSIAYAVSEDGAVVVGRGLDAGFRWENGKMISIEGITAWDVSGDGSVVVGRRFRWVNGMRTSFEGQPRAVSADGSVIVGVFGGSSGFGEAFRWENGVVAGLSDLPGGPAISDAYGLSDDGRVVVGQSWSASGTEAFRWENGVMIGLGDLPGRIFDSTAYDVSADGSTVVGRGDSEDGGQHWDQLFNEAFIWDAQNGMRALEDVLEDYGVDLKGWNLSRAEAVSNDGRTIVGAGVNPSGFAEGWIVVLPTLPGPCDDGIDNDGDGFSDFPVDPGCKSEIDQFEKDSSIICDDGVDNDVDGFADFLADADEDGISDPPGDPGCKDPSWPKEDPECQDGINNDLAPGIDFDGGLSVWGVAVDEPDLQCVGTPWSDHEYVPEPSLVVLAATALAAVALVARPRRG